MTTKLELKKTFFDAYDGFADKRKKKLENDAPFIIDDRSERDRDAQGQLFLWFCSMTAYVEEGQRVRVTLSGGVPMSETVSQWLEEHGADVRNDDYSQHAAFDVTPGNLADLPDLASRVGDIIKARYSVKAYRFVVPRVQDAILRLHAILAEAWG